MASLSSRMAARCSAMLADNGQLLTFSRISGSAYSPGSGTQTESSSSFSKYGVNVGQVKAHQASELVRAGDVALFMEPGDYQLGDEVSIDGEAHRVINVRPISTDGTVSGVYLDCRK